MAQLAVGDRAPAFDLVDQEGHRTRLEDLKTKRTVLYFFPKADTSG